METIDAVSLTGWAAAAVAVLGLVARFIIDNRKRGDDAEQKKAANNLQIREQGFDSDSQERDRLFSEYRNAIRRLDQRIDKQMVFMDAINAEHIKCREDNARLQERVLILERSLEVERTKSTNLENMARSNKNAIERIENGTKPEAK